MPTISTFFGIIIRMQYNDIGQHHKPHVHVQYAEYNAVVALDGDLLSGSIPVKQLRLVQAWITIHEDELYRAWNDAVRNIPLSKIEPLK
ncbi:MAG: DUF4160 domain-containing protein [Ruminococcaceae bacterium]|nr:DUF4160 domain-containing protein [Oscillospiraceae bacterium]